MMVLLGIVAATAVIFCMLMLFAGMIRAVLRKCT